MPEHPRNLGGSEKGRSLISAYRGLAITGKSLSEALIFASTNPQYYTTNQTQFGYSLEEFYVIA